MSLRHKLYWPLPPRRLWELNGNVGKFKETVLYKVKYEHFVSSKPDVHQNGTIEKNK